MDALDLKILATLDADARRPYADMAREFGISQPTVADRIRRLESRGIVRGAMLCVDHARLGFSVSAFVRLRASPSKKRGLTEAARAMQQVIEMHGRRTRGNTPAAVDVRRFEHIGGAGDHHTAAQSDAGAEARRGRQAIARRRSLCSLKG